MGRPGLETFTQDGAWRIPYVNVEFEPQMMPDNLGLDTVEL
jgi:hypothetical protein